MLAPDLIAERLLMRISRFVTLAASCALLACQSGPTKEELDAAKKTIDCQRAGERVLIRFEEGEARLLMPDGTRVILYQIDVASGLRYTNGLLDLRGKGFDFVIIRDGVSTPLTCKQYELPPKKE